MAGWEARAGGELSKRWVNEEVYDGAYLPFFGFFIFVCYRCGVRRRGKGMRKEVRLNVTLPLPYRLITDWYFFIRTEDKSSPASHIIRQK